MWVYIIAKYITERKMSLRLIPGETIMSWKLYTEKRERLITLNVLGTVYFPLLWQQNSLPSLKPRRAGCRSVFLWDKQHETRDSWRDPHSQEEAIDVRKISSFVSIGLILNKMQQFKNVKINKKCMDCGTQRPDVYSSNGKRSPCLHNLI